MTADPPALGESARRALLEHVRRAVLAAATGEPLPAAPAPDDVSDRVGAVFVTLYVNGKLRGCLGTFDLTRPLWENASEIATAAASRDPRFPPIERPELDGLAVTLSLLSSPKQVEGAEEIVIGRHGVEVSRGGRRGVLLPQVAVEHHLDAEGLLAETCRKAGLPADAWRDPGTCIRVFEADVLADTPA